MFLVLNSNTESETEERTMALIYAVEDDKNILEIEMFALKNSGYQVEGFECARDFIKSWKRSSRTLPFWTLCCG